MPEPLTIAGSLTSIAGLGTAFAQWWVRRQSDSKNATLERFIDWLRRQEHADLICRIDASRDAANELAALITQLKTSSDEQVATVLAQLNRQSKQLSSLDKDLRRTLSVIEDLPDVLDERLSSALMQWRKAIARFPENPPPSAEDHDYEEKYRAAIGSRLDEVELFGVDLAPEARQQQLSAAYISLNLGSSGRGSKGEIARAAQVFDSLNPSAGRLLIRGEAGSGKTTLMRWVAIRAARKDDAIDKPGSDIVRRFKRDLRVRAASDVRFSDVVEHAHGRVGFSTEEVRALVIQNAWTRRIPFLISVRTCRKGRFPPIEQYALQIGDEQGVPPTGWTQRVLNQGRGLILIDGIDETPPSYRAEIRKQVRQLAKLYSRCYLILTTRPSAVEDDWLSDLGFREAVVQPLTGHEREDFVDKWHEAVQAGLAKRGKTEDLTRLGGKLKQELRRNPGVARLATTPLLAAMVCALHRDRQQILPEAQYELVDALCHMLLFRRERESGLDLSEFPTEYRSLSYFQRRSILQRLAHYLVTQELSALDAKLATRKIAETLQTVPSRSASDAAVVLKGLIERSGMLCEKMYGSIDFIHNTFKEYLAARQFVQDVDIKGLSDKATNPEWDNVLLFAAATPESGDFATKLIGKIIPRASARKGGTKVARRSRADLVPLYRRKMMAVRMRAVAQHLDGQLEAQIKTMERQVYPPRTLADAAALAQTGAGMERHMRYKPSMSVDRKVACVRALRLMDTDAAKSAVACYAVDDNWPVVEELSQALNPLQIEEVVRRLQLGWDFERFREELSVRRRIDDLTLLGQRSGLRTLGLWNTRVCDLTPLVHLRGLETVDLQRTEITDVSPLSQLSRLRTLHLSRTGVFDVTALAQLSELRTLDLDYTKVSDLTPLAKLTGLLRLDLSNTPVSDVTALSSLRRLQKLDLSHTQIADLTPLAHLSALQSLDISGTLVNDLRPLTHISGLMWLNLAETRTADLAPLEHLKTVRIEC